MSTEGGSRAVANVTSALTGDHLFTLQLPENASAAIARRMIAEAVGSCTEAIALLSEGAPWEEEDERPLRDQVNLELLRLDLPNPPKVWDDIDFQIRVETHDSEQVVEISTRYLEWRPEERRLSDDELQKPGFYGNVMALRCDQYDDIYDDLLDYHTGELMASTEQVYHATKGYFTIAETRANIIAFETLHRPKTKWQGSIDQHHVFFEGLHLNPDGKTFRATWGS